MVSSHRIPTIAILRIFIGAIKQARHLGRGTEKTKKATKLNLSFSVSHEASDIIGSNKKSTSKKEPTSVSEIAISYLQKNIIIPLLCQCGLFIHTCVSKNSIVSKDVIFYFP